MVIVLGSVIFIIGFFGCCGAIKEINWCVMMYAVFMFVLMCLQIALVVWVFVKKDQFLNQMSDIVNDAWNHKTGKLDGPMNILQATFKCCGLTSYQNYNNYSAVPSTCCGYFDLTSVCPTSVYTNEPGCRAKFYDFWESNLEYFRYGGIAVAVVEFLALVSACILACAVRRTN